MRRRWKFGTCVRHVMSPFRAQSGVVVYDDGKDCVVFYPNNDTLAGMGFDSGEKYRVAPCEPNAHEKLATFLTAPSRRWVNVNGRVMLSREDLLVCLDDLLETGKPVRCPWSSRHRFGSR